MRHVFLLIFLIAQISRAHGNESWLTSSLEEIKRNPKAFMMAPPKKDLKTKERHSFDQKVKLRQKLWGINKKSNAKSAPQRGDTVEKLLTGRNLLKTLEAMEQNQLKSGRVAVQPWSDDYWPIYRGMLGNRYGDEEYPMTMDWKDYFEYVSSKSVSSILSDSVAPNLDLLSPSEKYDLLIGSQSLLTSVMWQEGQAYYDQSGKVETWMGICHGWAAAAFMVDRPSKKIVVPSHDGKYQIPFYPADLKALASLLWAQVETPTNFVGGRCNIKDPPKDTSGRFLNPECADNNPATFHMAVVNRVGVEKKSFVFDASYDYEVWNQPIIAYEYRYFNPKTLEEYASAKEAMVARADHAQDRFAKFRAPQAKYLVGIGLKLTYGVENRPVMREFENERFDSSTSVQYVYDLELDENYNLIGGEWYQNKHPDFLWLPVESARALTPVDYTLLASPLWDGKAPLDRVWKSGAQRMAARGVPLALILESLINLSNKN